MSKHDLSFFCFVFAFFLAATGSTGWGWFLFIGVILL
ncbi:hypothetical protein SEEN978_09099 [Salmonella enterica subsp. enterica serovar Newport str. CVM 37978]|nr:hypothetical protein SEEN978_09099 [Salmonella enterica subsp. enterica serovar Newport str. CVM 37978]